MINWYLMWINFFVIRKLNKERYKVGNKENNGILIYIVLKIELIKGR